MPRSRSSPLVPSHARSRNKRKAVLVIALVLGGSLGPYVGVFAYAVHEYNGIARDLAPPDPASFVPVNATRLAAMAAWYEDNIPRYHMPHDMIVNTWFNASGVPAGSPHGIARSSGSGTTATTGTPSKPAVPVYYAVEYDSAEWTGHYLLAEACRHAVATRAGDETAAALALGNITRALRGYDKILHVAPNGGMARYAVPVSEYSGDLAHLRDSEHVGTWQGVPHVYRDDTSRDMHNGVIMGLGATYYLVADPGTRATVCRLVETLLDYMLARGWLYVDPDDVPNGTDLDAGFWLFGTTGLWTLAYLRAGVLVNPAKYGPVYAEYLEARDYLHRSNFPWAAAFNTVQAYYGLLLDWELLFLLWLLEPDPDVRAVVREHTGVIYDLVRYDRNALFHVMWLAMNNVTRGSASSAHHQVIEDAEDCLMRYYAAPQRLPGRNANLTNPAVASPVAAKWRAFFSEGAGHAFYPFWRQVFQFEDIAGVALTPDLRPYTDFLWSRPPYWYQQTYHPRNQWRAEGPSVDYTVVYWLGRWFELFEPPAGPVPAIRVAYGVGGGVVQ